MEYTYEDVYYSYRCHTMSSLKKNIFIIFIYIINTCNITNELNNKKHEIGARILVLQSYPNDQN